MSTPQPAQTTPRRYQLFIDGQFVDAESGKTFNSPNPATGETFAEVAEADKADIDKAVAAARKAFEGKWSKMSARDRGRLLYKLSQLIERDTAQLAELETNDNGSRLRNRPTSTFPASSRILNTLPAGPPRLKAKQFRCPERCSTTPCGNRLAFAGRSFPGISRS